MIQKENIRRFKAVLFYEMLPRLIREGSTGMSLPKLYPEDESGRFVVPVQSVIDFFLNEVQAEQIPSAGSFLKSLHSLFTIFSQGLDNFAIKAAPLVSEQDIQSADNSKAVEFLTKNLIISFFDNIQSYDGTVNTSILDENLDRLIQISNAGRDYRVLLENTFEILVSSLKKDQTWIERLAHIKNAELVCVLVGERLGKIDPSVLSGLFQQAGDEMGQNNILLQKIRRTKDHCLFNLKDQKDYIKIALKLDKSHEKVLARTDAIVGQIRTAAHILKIEPGKLMGKQAALLDENLAAIFFGHKGKAAASCIQESYAMARASMDRLFRYPELTACCSSFKDFPEYRPLILGIQKLYFQKLNINLEGAVAAPRQGEIKRVEDCLHEWERLTSNISLDIKPFEAEAAALQKKYLQLIHQVPVEMLSMIISFSPGIRKVACVPEYEFKETVRNGLLTGCFESLMGLQPVPGQIHAFKKDLKRTLAGYAEHFSPRRFFYRNFFETCVGMFGSPTTELFNNLTQTHKILARELALLFSEPDNLGQFLQETHHEYAQAIVEGLSG